MIGETGIENETVNAVEIAGGIADRLRASDEVLRRVEGGGEITEGGGAGKEGGGGTIAEAEVAVALLC